MTFPRAAAASIVLITLALGSGCSDSPTGPPKPASIALVIGDAQSATVGASIATAPSFVVKDGAGTPIANVALSVTVGIGGGTLVGAPTVSSNGATNAGRWTLGTTAGANTIVVAVQGLTPLTITATGVPDVPTQLLVSGDQQLALAGGTVGPIRVRVADKYGNAIPNQTASFSVSAGGGSLASRSATSGDDGAITVPAWTLGRFAQPQALHVSAGAFATDISATIQTDYTIDVRFFGPVMTDQQKALFTNAAARISAVVTGSLQPALVNVDGGFACGIAGVPVINETIRNLVIYASIADIDGQGKILAESGPCVLRNSTSGSFAAVGVMLFDAADIALMASQGITQDVITHEMLHVVGIGTLWKTKALITAAGTPNVTYRGASARQSCIDDGGSGACAMSVPVENNGVIGTTDSHWRESTFGSELMTGFVNLNGMPFSAITVGSLADMGYTVNLLAADPYRVPVTGTGASAALMPLGTPGDWEKPLPGGVILPNVIGGAPTFIRNQ